MKTDISNFRTADPSAMHFKLELTKLVASLEPLTKAIKCLEASETTAAAVTRSSSPLCHHIPTSSKQTSTDAALGLLATCQ